jgi:hypothetical protein
MRRSDSKRRRTRKAAGPARSRGRKRARSAEAARFETELTVLGEPLLEFAYGQTMPDPHDGLSVFGPYDLHASGQPKNLVLGLIATTDGKRKFIDWVKSAQGPIAPGKNRRGEDLDARLWPVFPGFEAVFGCKLPSEPAWFHKLEQDDLERVCLDMDAKKRAYGAVEQYLAGIRLTEKKDEQFNVLVCVVPDAVKRACRPKSYVAHGTGYAVSSHEQQRRASGQTDFFDPYDPEIYRYSEDFRRQLKARSMQYKVPVQIIKESTITRRLPGEKLLTSPPSDVAWNLLTTIYYKAGGKPWRLAAARPGVCYIGIAFRRTDPTSNSRSACCAAQMFLDSGDGIVFLGDSGLWYSPEHKQFHLSPEAATKLLRGVLESYRQLEGQPLTEIFLHCRSGILGDEFTGYHAACPSGIKLVGVRVRKDRDGLRFFREGKYPPVRSSVWIPHPRTAYLYASGVVPRLGTYPGTEAPVPLRIDVQHGEADIVQVARDILALTKLNYNECKFGDSEPVTIGFSDAVGEILVSNPTVKNPSPKFKFYI